MNNKIEIPPNHKRTLSIMAQQIESYLFETKNILQNKDEFMLTRNIRKTISPEVSQQILSLINEMLKINGEMFFDLELSPDDNYDSRIIKSRIAYLWSVIADHASDRMIGYGKLEPPEAEFVDKYIKKLLAIVDKIQSINMY